MLGRHILTTLLNNMLLLARKLMGHVRVLTRKRLLAWEQVSGGLSGILLARQRLHRNLSIGVRKLAGVVAPTAA